MDIEEFENLIIKVLILLVILSIVSIFNFVFEGILFNTKLSIVTLLYTLGYAFYYGQMYKRDERNRLMRADYTTGQWKKI